MPTAVKKLRQDFPAFVVKPEWVYLDTAATAQMPQVVLDAMGEHQCAYRASVHRGLYKEAARATEVYEGARASVARFIDAAHPSEVIFTSGATASSNLLVRMLERSMKLRPRDEIVTTVMEHHSSLVPLQELARRNHLALKHIPITREYALDYAAARSLIGKRTKIVSVMLASNVLGTVNNLRRIVRLAHENGAIVVSDATAAIGHLPVSVRALGVDYLYFSGHKMCGPTGIGVLYGKHAHLADLEPVFYGGGMVDDVTLTRATWADLPARFEAGTPNVTGAIGLGAAAEYLMEHKLLSVRTYVEALVRCAHDALRKVPGVRLYSAPPADNVGIVSFLVDGVHPHDLAEIAARRDVALRAGHHCTLPLHTALGLSATVRASFYFYNTKADADRLAETAREAVDVFRVR